MTTRRNIVPPNLTIAPKDYEQRYQEQLNNVQRLFYTTIANRVNLALPYGSFYSSMTVADYPANPLGGNLTNAGFLTTPKTANLVPFLNTSVAFNTTIGQQNTRIYVAETGVYNVQFSAQCDLTSGSNGDFYFWLRKNGTDIQDTAGKVVVAGPNAETMAAWNYILTLQEGDYIELAWSSSDTHAYLQVEAAPIVAPIRPALPAVILSICWVSPINTSVGIS